jgi:hypothetical protein
MSVHDKADALVVKGKPPSVQAAFVVMRAAVVPGAVAIAASRPMATDAVKQRAAVTVPPMLPKVLLEQQL